MTDAQPIAPSPAPNPYPATPDPSAPAVPKTSTTNTLAMLSLLFGILGSVLAPVLGHIALSQMKRNGAPGRGVAIAGTILGYFWTAIYLGLIVAFVVYGIFFYRGS